MRAVSLWAVSGALLGAGDCQTCGKQVATPASGDSSVKGKHCQRGTAANRKPKHVLRQSHKTKPQKEDCHIG